MGRSLFPASQVASMTIASVSVTPKGDITYAAEQTVRTPIADAHTINRKMQIMHKPGLLTLTLVTDNSNSEWQSILNAENVPISISFLSGRNIQIPAATAFSEDGISQNTTQGESSEFSFQFSTSIDNGPPQP
jgi:hypothetical protein